MLRVGTVPYLVARPLDLGLEDEPDVELARAVPARLVEGLRSGGLDVALVSSVELFRRPGYSFLDGLAVAGRGFVSSVQVFLRRPLAQVATVALDPASRTAATLARIVWPEHATRFLEPEGGVEQARAEADAWLEIGDAALRAWSRPAAPPVFNPSQAWTETTGLPFAFAVWVARPGLDLSPWAPLFRRARARGAEQAPRLAHEAARRLGIRPALARRYLLEECLFEPGPELVGALLAFRDAAAERGLARSDLELVPVGDR